MGEEVEDNEGLGQKCTKLTLIEEIDSLLHHVSPRGEVGAVISMDVSILFHSYGRKHRAAIKTTLYNTGETAYGDPPYADAHST